LIKHQELKLKNAVKYLVLLWLAFTGLSASAQILNEDTTTHQPFFKATKFSSKCYVGLDASAVQILKTRAGSNFGVNLNWVVNHKFVVSAIYDGLASPNQIQKIVTPNDHSDTVTLMHRYVGLGFSYILFDNKMFSLQPGLSAGWGYIQYTYDGTTCKDNFAEVVPAVTATYNCTKYFRFGLGLNYRIAAGAKLNGLNSADISGVGGIIFIKVGTF
jgi:hypothetical protein